MTLDDLRRFAVARSLFAQTTLAGAVERLGFVQADPIRAPARAQDLTLRHRVVDYRAGDLERHYAALEIEEDTFINYGFLPRAAHALMQPRPGMRSWLRAKQRRVQTVLDFVGERGSVHPRDVDAHFAHGVVTNYWGGSSNATTHLLEHMHYGGLLRVARRERGIRVYELARELADPPSRAARRQQIDALVDLVVLTYAPVSSTGLSRLISRLRYAVPQWRRELRDAVSRARQRLGRDRVDGVDWYRPAAEQVRSEEPLQTVRLLAPFDPVVWDRQRFEQFWGWAYRFEAYTPIAARKLGYYALPLLCRDQVIGWANVSLRGHTLSVETGYVAAEPKSRLFKRELEAEIERMRQFLIGETVATSATGREQVLNLQDSGGRKMRNKDELKGKVEQAKGKIKQGIGEVTDDERLREEGVADEAAGELREGFGKAKRKVGDAIEDVGEAIKNG